VTAETLSIFMIHRPLLQTIALLCLLGVYQSAMADIVRTRDHLRGQRYGEVLVVTGGPLSFTGHVYNTIGLNNCPEAEWKALNPKELAREYKARAVILNGPRYFLMDQNSLANPGSVATFGGLQARHLANVNISLLTMLHGRAKPYTENTVKRSSEYVYREGRPVYELLAPDGRVYVMQTYALIVDPNLTEADLATLGKRLKLPAGWKYRTRILDRDLVLRTTGTAYVLQDTLQNSYQRSTAPSPKS
jgi:hypothetical protein